MNPAPVPPAEPCRQDESVPSPQALAREVADTIDAILRALHALLWTFVRYAVALGPLLTPVLNRINRTRQRLARALGHLADGRPPRPPRQRTRAPRPARPHDPHSHVPVRRHGWLGALLDHHVRGRASQLEVLLARPGVAELIAASPGAARTLRPLCRMLGAALPPPLRPPPRPPRPRPARPPKPASDRNAAKPPGPGLLPGDRPFRPYVLKAVRYHKRAGLWRPWKPE